MKKLVIWDWNGTLLNDRKESIESINPTLKKRNIKELELDYYLEIFDFPIRDYYRKIGIVDDQDFDIAANEYIDIYSKKQIPLALDALSTLEAIHALGISQMILTASKIENFTMQAKPFDILKYFDYIVGLDNIFAKSKKEVFIDWLKTHPIKKEDMLIIGDTYHDYEIAHELGIDFLLCVGHGHQAKSRFADMNIKMIDELSEVVDYIKNET